MAQQERVTREELRAMRTGETRVFDLPGAAAIENARTAATMVGNIEKCRFTCAADYANNRVIITKYAAS